MTGRYEQYYFGNDGWVYFSQGLKRIPESPPPISVGGCVYNGYIDSHPKQGEGAVSRVMRFPGVDYTQNIEVENCGDKYVYFLTKTITANYCYVADTDVCSDNVYKEVDDVRRLHYSHKYGYGFTRCEFKCWQLLQLCSTGQQMFDNNPDCNLIINCRAAYFHMPFS